MHRVGAARSPWQTAYCGLAHDGGSDAETNGRSCVRNAWAAVGARSFAPSMRSTWALRSWPRASQSRALHPGGHLLRRVAGGTVRVAAHQTQVSTVVARVRDRRVFLGIGVARGAAAPRQQFQVFLARETGVPHL